MPALPTQREWVLAALQEHELRLLRYALRLLGEEASARDVVQHALLRLCSETPEKHPQGPTRWLFTVARNRALDVLRRRGRERALLADEALPDSLSCDEFNPAANLEQQDLLALVRRLIDELPPGPQEVALLWSEGFSYVQMAQITSRSESSLRVMVHRVVERLKQHPSIMAITEQKHVAIVPNSEPEALAPGVVAKTHSGR